MSIAVDLFFAQDLTQELDVQRDCVIDVAYGPRLLQSQTESMML